MVVAVVDRALERLLRAELPLPEDVGDVSFDVPERSWGAQLSRITVNAFLFEVARSPQPPRAAEERVRADGRLERRPPLPLVRLSYLVSAWAGGPADEHELLGEVLAVLVRHQTLPAEHLESGFPSVVQLALGTPEGRRLNDVWSALEGRLKPAVELQVTVPLTSEPWRLAPPAVERIASLVAPRPQTTAAPPQRRTAVHREPDGTLVATAERQG